MPNYCAVQNCKSYSKNKSDSEIVKFFSFPKDKNVMNLWIRATGKKKVNTKYARVCSLHFTDHDWRLQDRLLNVPMNKRFLNPKAVPSKMLPGDTGNEISILINQRAEKRNSRRIVEEAIKESMVEQCFEIKYLEDDPEGSCIIDTTVDADTYELLSNIEQQSPSKRRPQMDTDTILSDDDIQPIHIEQQSPSKRRPQMDTDTILSVSDDVQPIETDDIQNKRKKKIKFRYPGDISTINCFNTPLSGNKTIQFLRSKLKKKIMHIRRLQRVILTRKKKIARKNELLNYLRK